MASRKLPHRHLARSVGGADQMPDAPAGIVVERFDAARDAAAVHGLLAPTYEEFDDGYDLSPFDKWCIEVLEDEEFCSDAVFLARSEQGEPAGVVISWASGFIYDLAVAAKWRKRGIGEYLLRRTFAHFAAKGIERIELKVVCGNPTGAERLYERMGFADVVPDEDVAGAD